MQADWSWARRGRRRAPGSKEVLYDQCFDSSRAADRSRAAEMKARWREETTFNALDDSIAHLAAQREERKTVLAVTDGWQLFTPNRTLGEPDDEKSSQSDRLRRSGDRGSVQGSPATPVMRVECEADWRRLAMLDNSLHLRDVSESANRANVSFYPLYTPEVTVPVQGVPRAVPEIDHAAARMDSLRLLADGTDGLAVLKRTAVEEAIPRIAADASSYYLVTYRFEQREARWTVPDAQRQGRPARRENPDASRPSRSHHRRAAEHAAAARSRARGNHPLAIPVTAADARRPFRIRTSSWAAPDGGTFWIVGELDYRTRQELDWTAGAKADVVVLRADGTELLSQTLTVEAGGRRLLAARARAGGGAAR